MGQKVSQIDVLDLFIQTYRCLRGFGLLETFVVFQCYSKHVILPIFIMSDKFEDALKAINLAHKKDPNKEELGAEIYSSEWLYAKRMQDTLKKIYPKANQGLVLAASCQHLYRWEIKRSDYPNGKIGYYKWRNYLVEYQANKAEVILKECQFDTASIQKVIDIMKKENIHKLEDSQKLEDIVCIVFLEHYMEPFAADKTDEHLIQIVQKTWNKMSENGKKEALKLNLPLRTKKIVEAALF